MITTLRGSISASHNTWAGVLYDGETLFESPQYQITDIVDRVGGGDSFMGGLIYGSAQISRRRPECVEFCGCRVLLEAHDQGGCQPGDSSRGGEAHGR